ncbi:N/A [soil metagenome]
MNGTLRTWLSGILCVVALAASNAAHALGATCTVSSTATAFGYYDPVSPTANDTTGSVSVSCQAAVALAVSYQISLSAGTYGTYAQRQLGASTQRLGYQLYTNTARSSIWGDGTAGTSVVSDGYLLSILGVVSKDYQVYGRMPAQQNVAPGTYNDVITVLLSY